MFSANLYTLARIGKVNCGCDRILTEFRVKTLFDHYGKNPQTRIFYTCCSSYLKNLKKFKKIRKTTGWNDSGYGRNTFLDRHQFIVVEMALFLIFMR